MNIKQLDALSAYSEATKQAQGGLESRGGEGADKSAFSSLVSEGLGDVAEATKHLEQQSASALVGKADLVDVATAVQNAEMVVQTVVTVRDKVVAAYNDILKMPI